MSRLLSAVPIWVILVLAVLVVSLLSVFSVLIVVGFVQGRPVSLWPPGIGPRPGEDAGKQPEEAHQASSEQREERQLAPASVTFAPNDQWRRNVFVEHDKLFGVDWLIDSVATAVNSSSANWVVSLFGDGGIGKTAAAYEATVRCAESGQFSRVAWASATNISLSRLTSTEVVTGTVYWLDLIRSIAQQVDADLGLSRTLWERELAQHVGGLSPGERILTVIDNLESVEDAQGIVRRLDSMGLVRPHKVIVTTRWSIQEYSSAATEFRVSGLSTADALSLIRHLGRGDRELTATDPAILEPVLTVTEGNPFLIKLVIEHYRETHRSLELVMAELTDLRGAKDGPSASLGGQVRGHLYVRSLNELANRVGTETSAKLMSAFCTKGKGDAFSRAELSVVSGIPEPAAFDHALECACRLALVRSSHLNQAYSIHSLLHEFTCRPL